MRTLGYRDDNCYSRSRGNKYKGYGRSFDSPPGKGGKGIAKKKKGRESSKISGSALGLVEGTLRLRHLCTPRTVRTSRRFALGLKGLGRVAERKGTPEGGLRGRRKEKKQMALKTLWRSDPEQMQHKRGNNLIGEEE